MVPQRTKQRMNSTLIEFDFMQHTVKTRVTIEAGCRVNEDSGLCEVHDFKTCSWTSVYMDI